MCERKPGEQRILGATQDAHEKDELKDRLSRYARFR